MFRLCILLNLSMARLPSGYRLKETIIAVTLMTFTKQFRDTNYIGTILLAKLVPDMPSSNAYNIVVIAIYVPLDYAVNH
jgi:hypothetical protein